MSAASSSVSAVTGGRSQGLQERVIARVRQAFAAAGVTPRDVCWCVETQLRDESPLTVANLECVSTRLGVEVRSLVD